MRATRPRTSAPPARSCWPTAEHLPSAPRSDREHGDEADGAMVPGGDFHMKRAWIICTITAAVAIAFISLAMTAATAAAQRGAAAAPANKSAAPVPRMPDGHPDLSGVWWRGSDVGLRPLADAPTPV